MGLFRSADRGKTWQDMEIGRFSPLTPTRATCWSRRTIPRTLVAALSPAARSKDGSLYRSDDLGQSWRRIDHGIKAESTMMAVVRCTCAIPIRSTASRGWARSSARGTVERAGRSGASRAGEGRVYAVACA